MTADVDAKGFAIRENVLTREAVASLLSALEALVDAGRGGVRDVMSRVPALREVAECAAVRGLVTPMLGESARVVRATLFDKTPESNWKVPWHQDVTIAVQERIPREGYGPWSVKAGVVHVQPPVDVLENMLSVRVHLDDCPAENGALKVISGSHLCGKIPEKHIEEVVRSGSAVVCAVGVGGALLMRPLLVHSSSASTMAGHRRVLHFDYAAVGLTDGLQWAI